MDSLTPVISSGSYRVGLLASGRWPRSGKCGSLTIDDIDNFKNFSFSSRYRRPVTPESVVLVLRRMRFDPVPSHA